MTTMWKPGTSKPKSAPDEEMSTPMKVQTTTTSSLSSTTTTPASSKKDSSSAKKKLSGATMGMRFMLRSKPTESSKPSTTPSPKKEEDRMDIDESDNGESDEEDDGTSSNLPQIATASDMYGLKGSLLGRRSFGGFNKFASENWNENLESYHSGKAGERAKKQHISDDELLERYKNYVHGRGDFGGVDKAAAAPVGNLKKQQRKSQSPRSGEKRQRR